MGKLDGQVAFITGAGRGQGRSRAIRLAEDGGSVAYDLATPDDLAETARAVEATGRRILAREADVRDSAALKSAADEGVERFGRLDIALTNAGIFSAAPTFAMSDETWQEMIDIDLTGAFKSLRASVPHVISRGRGGSVVITSSLAALQVNDNPAHPRRPRRAWS